MILYPIERYVQLKILAFIWTCKKAFCFVIVQLQFIFNPTIFDKLNACYFYMWVFFGMLKSPLYLPRRPVSGDRWLPNMTSL